jgi:poly-gamma-glutamate capsule biosynthesis protein CapA/YwtB (metallophosphatase superfamily)
MRPGVNRIADVSEGTLDSIASQVRATRTPDDLLIASIHWGGNWGYDIPSDQRSLAHGLIDSAGFHLVHGHSSHHAKAMELHRGHLILYGCGDFITDYEGSSGYEEFRGDLSVAYLPSLSPSGRLVDMEMFVYRLRKFRLEPAPSKDVLWLEQHLNENSAAFGTRLKWSGENILRLEPAAAASCT